MTVASSLLPVAYCLLSSQRQETGGKREEVTLGYIIRDTSMNSLLSSSKKITNSTLQKISLMQRIKQRGEADIKLKQKLVEMAGNAEEAEKLIAKQRFGKEGKYSENYCCWLAIRELEKQGNE
ncbi:MAG: hypothetical protein F6J92_05415 [Symploca sp. SIO1A3]|nr:hypothetical protein [Symploca sp. SIO1A3]